MNMPNSTAKIFSNNGFIAFFDIMGFKRMIANNDLQKSTEVVLEMFQIVKDVFYEDIHLINYKLRPEFSPLSDSILIYQIPTDHGSQVEAELSRSCFVSLCGRLTAKFLIKGLPIRGAIGKGEFSIINEKTFTGKCIIQAYTLAESLQLAGCAVVPTLESEFSKNGETVDALFQNDLIYWQTLLKDLSTEKLLMLNLLNHMTEPAEDISQATLIEKFSAYGKGFDSRVLTKVIETGKFLKECKKHIKPNQQNV